MAVSPEDLVRIDEMLSAPGVDGRAVGELRRALPHLSWTRCDASDMTDPPYRSYPRIDIHLLDSADHCIVMTNDPGRATGIVVAERTIAS